MLAQDAGSVVRLDALTRFTDAEGTAAGETDGRWSSLAVASGGAIEAPALATLVGIDLTLDGGGTLPLDAIRSLTSGRIQTIGVSVTLPGLTDVDGSTLIVSGGGRLALPGVTSYDHAATESFLSRTLRAEGSGSVLDLSGVQSVRNGTFYQSRLFIQAAAGGTVDLRGATGIADPTDGDTRRRSIEVTADGIGSTIRLDTLASFTDINGTAAGETDGRFSALAAHDGATIQAPLLTRLIGVDLAVDGGATLPTSQIASFRDGRITFVEPGHDFGGLTDASRAQLVVSGIPVTLPALDRIDGASFLVSGGGGLSLPSARFYDQGATANFQTRTWKAEGAGSVLDLSALTRITNGVYYQAGLDINALDGGTIDLGVRHHDHRPDQRRYPPTLHQPPRRRHRQHDPPRRPDHDDRRQRHRLRGRGRPLVHPARPRRRDDRRPLADEPSGRGPDARRDRIVSHRAARLLTKRADHALGRQPRPVRPPRPDRHADHRLGRPRGPQPIDHVTIRSRFR